MPKFLKLRSYHSSPLEESVLQISSIRLKEEEKKDDELMLMIKRFQNDYIISLGISLKHTYFADRDKLFDQIELL